jgi:hypothetical protein
MAGANVKVNLWRAGDAEVFALLGFQRIKKARPAIAGTGLEF